MRQPKAPKPDKVSLRRLPIFLTVGAALFSILGIAIWLSGSSLSSSSPIGPTPTVGYGPVAQTPLAARSASSLLTVMPQVIDGPTPLASRSPAITKLADRFGIIITALEGRSQSEKEAGLKHALANTGAHWWYQYGAKVPDVPEAQQVQLVRVPSKLGAEAFKQQLDELLAGVVAPSAKTVYWMVGNEPNTPGQDNVAPEVYAQAFEIARQTIKQARPQDLILAPNVLNWNYTCSGCPGYTKGLEWVEKFRQAYRQQNNKEAPVDIWTIHTYSLDWDNLPLINQKRDAQQLEALRGYLDTSPGERGKPIWLTEFGVIWGYDGLKWEKDAKGNWKALPMGRYRTDLLNNYLEDSLNWLESNALRLNLGRWFLFTTYGLPEQFSDNFNGLALFEGVGAGSPLSPFGQTYQKHISRTFA